MDEFLINILNSKENKNNKYNNICFGEKKVLNKCLKFEKKCEIYEKLYNDCIKFKQQKKSK